MTKRVGLVLATVLLAGACSASFSIGGKSPEDAATELIEGDLAEQIGVELVATCPDLDDPDVGDVFACTASTPDGEVIDLTVDIGEDEVFASSVNVLLPDSVPEFELALVTALNDANDLEIPPEELDCGPGPVIVPPSSEFVCRLTDGDTGDVYDATVTITDQATWGFSVSIADDPS